MIRQILQDSSVAQGWWEEGREAGERAGREAGEREGHEQGRQEGQRELVRLALEDRFGTLADDEVAALAVAEATTLRAIVTHLAADSRAQVRARLGLPS